MLEMSYDHKPDHEKEKNRVKNAGGFISDGRINGNLNLSRAMGDLEYKRNTDLKVDE
jgi:protein phosphatase 1G